MRELPRHSALRVVRVKFKANTKLVQSISIPLLLLMIIEDVFSKDE